MTTPAESRPGPANRLISERSPYLLQHAHNPVDWYAWGDAAFDAAREQDKPVFLSIGYSTCHWCHVMEEESFSDRDVAALMNETCICIKVDREERLDIDQVYMSVCQLLTGSGGWPLTVIMTPDRHPFFAGTYFPKSSRYGRPGMMDLIPRIAEVWRTHRSDLESTGRDLVRALDRMTPSSSGSGPDIAVLDAAFASFSRRFDRRHGGFGTAPKFPSPHNLLFLLGHWHRTGNRDALIMAEETLLAMYRGGIFDQVGFGFHRYSTDERWRVPHFEKMLYDQALLLLALTETHLAAGNPELREAAERTAAYVLRDLTAPSGGFFSAEDADSEGVEGRFYLWQLTEIQTVLSGDELRVAEAVFNLLPGGNCAFPEAPPGSNIPHRTVSYTATAERLDLTEAHLQSLLAGVRSKLFRAREAREHPFKDNKILTDWNGLLIAALARTGAGLDQPAYIRAAERAADFILQTMQSEGRLLHRYRDGCAGIAATASDYAYMIWGLLELFDASQDPERLSQAVELNRVLLEDFWDNALGGVYTGSSTGEPLISRMMEYYDGAVPSANSVTLANLVRLARLIRNEDLQTRADALAQRFSAEIHRQPEAYTMWLVAFQSMVTAPWEITIAGPADNPVARSMTNVVLRRFFPNRILVRSTGDAQLTELLPHLNDQPAVNGLATAYICRDTSCLAPITGLADFEVVIP